MPLIFNDPLIGDVNTNNPVSIKYTNNGNALVGHVLLINDNNPTPPLSPLIDDWQGYLAKGVHRCFLTTNVYTSGAMGRLCKSTITINNQLVANMVYVVQNTSDTATIFTYFTITIS